MARRKQRVEEPEEHVNHERWLVTYADMITLLMVLFIVMFAISQVDERKFTALKSGLSAGFGQESSVMQGATGVLDTTGDAPLLSEAGSEDLRIEQAVNDAARQRNRTVFELAKAEADRLDEIRRAIRRAVQARGLERDITTRIDERGLVISLVSRHIVFRNDLATLTARGRSIVSALGPVLARLPDDLEIAGHTNQVPVTPKYYDSDWDLAAARAITVLRRLTEREEVALERAHAASYGNTMPLIDPADPTSQDLNKRVDIVVLTNLTGEARELLEDAADQGPPRDSDITGEVDPDTDTDTDRPSQAAGAAPTGTVE